MKNIVYIKTVDSYDDILKKEHKKIPQILKKIIFLFKNIFNIVTKKNIDGYAIWVLPLQEEHFNNKLKTTVQKLRKNQENIYVLSNSITLKPIYKVMDKYNIKYLTGKKTNKILLVKILEYITKIQGLRLSNIEVCFLVNEPTETNIYILETISKLVKEIKIVTKNMYKFKKLEARLYNELGIAIQFSNSYKKSLSKSKIVINLDFNEIDINEYIINNNTLIINCTDNNLRIKSKLFNGIIVNSFNIKFRKEIEDKFKSVNIYDKYNNLLLYESIICEENDLNKLFDKVENDKITITSLIGNNGNITKKEIKNIVKKA